MKYDYLDYEQIKKMGERIKISRKSNNMTQSELADILGISADQVSNIELGKSACKIDHIYLLMQVLDISADYLFGNFVNTNVVRVTDEQIINMATKTNKKMKMIIYELLMLRHSTHIFFVSGINIL